MLEEIEIEKIEYEGAEIQRFELVESVLSRPGMYTGTESFDAAMAFLNGYEFALLQTHAKTPEGGDWTGFKRWYVRKINGPSNMNMSYALVEAEFGTGREAIAEMLRLYREFRSEQS